MVDRSRDGLEDDIADLAEGKLPGIDLDLGSDSRISGGDDLADYDEENLYGNDVLVDPDEEEESGEDGDIFNELTDAEIAELERRREN